MKDYIKWFNEFYKGKIKYNLTEKRFERYLDYLQNEHDFMDREMEEIKEKIVSKEEYIYVKKMFYYFKK